MLRKLLKKIGIITFRMLTKLKGNIRNTTLKTKILSENIKEVNIMKTKTADLQAKKHLSMASLTSY